MTDTRADTRATQAEKLTAAAEARLVAVEAERVMCHSPGSRRTNTRIIEHAGRQWSLSELAKAHGLKPATLFQRVIRSRWPVDRALSVPAKPKRWFKPKRPLL